MKYERKLLAALRRADFNFGLIDQNDRILLGISGGKDSLALLKLLTVYQKFSDKNFEFEACFLDLGFPQTDLREISDWASKLGIRLTVEDCREVYPILRQHLTSGGILPCSICSRMKKAAINGVAKKLGCNKVAFAHHADDAIETLFMNMTHGGRIATFSPKMTLERAGIVFIRPLIYARESDIRGYAEEQKLPVLKSTCGNDKESERAEIKSLLEKYYSRFKDARDNFLTMLTNYEKFDVWFDDYGSADGNGFFIRRVETYREYLDSARIRQKVFVEEQKIALEAEIDGTDSGSALYFIGTYHDKPVATVRLLLDGPNCFILGRLAVLKDFRSRGFGSKLVRHVEKILSHRGVPLTIKLNSQLTAVSFYRRLGYSEAGPEFDEAGRKHVSMQKIIAKPIMDKEKKR